MQTSDEWMMSRVEQPEWFCAPDSMPDKCIACGQPIRVNEIITEWDMFSFVHERCIERGVGGYIL